MIVSIEVTSTGRMGIARPGMRRARWWGLQTPEQVLKKLGRWVFLVARMAPSDGVAIVLRRRTP